MARRRMLSAGFLRQEAFLTLPLMVQAVYFHLIVFADDDGFVDNPSRVVRMVDGEQSMLSLLEDKGFLISFESGCGVIRHWLKHNSIRKDRYTPTVYQKEMSMLCLTEDHVYELRKNLTGSPEDTIKPNTSATGSASEANNLKCVEWTGSAPEQEKESVPPENEAESSCLRIQPCSNDRPKNATAAPVSNPGAPYIPTLAEVRAFAAARNSKANVDQFYYHYAALGWRLSNQPIRDWKSAFYLWESREENYQKKMKRSVNSTNSYSQRDYTGCEESMDEVLNRLKNPQDQSLMAVTA